MIIRVPYFFILETRLTYAVDPGFKKLKNIHMDEVFARDTIGRYWKCRKIFIHGCKSFGGAGKSKNIIDWLID